MKGGGKMEDKLGKTESKVAYDDRRKELTHQVDSEQEAKNNEGETVGIVKTKMVGVYKEEGIRKIVSEMQNEVVQLEKDISSAKKMLENFQNLEETEEIRKYKELQEKLTKLKQKEQFENQMKELEGKLKTTKTNLNQIKEVIGTRLKL